MVSPRRLRRPALQKGIVFMKIFLLSRSKVSLRFPLSDVIATHDLKHENCSLTLFLLISFA
jgi:hypothetical protein